ncbi:MAG: DUF3891 family protein [Planctomycetota bacterium]
MIVVTTTTPPYAVRQTDHAAMAGRLAAWWPLERVPGLVDPTIRGLFIEAVRHHDDGWYGWEATPARDEATGQPVDFKSISTTDHIQIWKDSVDACAKRHPYIGLLVAKHALSLYLKTLNTDNVNASRHTGYEHDVMVADAMAWLTERALELDRRLRDVGEGWTRILNQIDEHRRIFTVFDAFTLMMLGGVPRQDKIRIETDYQLGWIEGERRVTLEPWPVNQFKPNLIAVETLDGHTIEWSLEPAGHAETASPSPRPVTA